MHAAEGAHTIIEIDHFIEPPQPIMLFVGEPGIGLRTLRAVLAATADAAECSEECEDASYTMEVMGSAMKLSLHTDASKPLPAEQKQAVIACFVCFIVGDASSSEAIVASFLPWAKQLQHLTATCPPE